jgi:hypothetical protein
MLYGIGVDQYDVPKGDCAICVVKKGANTNAGYVVAMYEGRPPISEIDFKNQIELISSYYNATPIVEK